MALDVEEGLYTLVSRYFWKPRGKIGANTRFKKDLKADSLDFLEFVLIVEEAYRCPLDDEALSSVVTVGDFSQLLEMSIARNDLGKE